MTDIYIGNKKMSVEDMQAKLQGQYDRQKEYHKERNALITKLVAFHKEFSGKCTELDEFMLDSSENTE